MLFGLPGPVLSLSLATGLGMTLAIMSVSVGPQAGLDTAPSAIFASVPYALQFFATMAIALPLTGLFGRFGRKPVVIGASIVGGACGLFGYLGVTANSFVYMCMAHIALGVLLAALTSLRFASAEMVSADIKARAVALTSFGGTFGAIVGPVLVRRANDLFGFGHLPSVYTLMSVVVVVVVLLIVFTPFQNDHSRSETAKAKANPSTEKVSTGALLASSLFLFALISGATSYGIMSGLMTGSNLQMKTIGVAIDVNSFLIQFHVLAMFGPSLITGQVLNLLGQRTFFIVGILVLLGAPIAGLFAPSVFAFATSLILLGFGWNMLYVGGSALIAKKIHCAQKLRSQGLYDTAASLFSAVATLSSALLLAVFGWEGMQIAALILIAAMICVAIWTQFGTKDDAKTTA